MNENNRPDFEKDGDEFIFEGKLRRSAAERAAHADASGAAPGRAPGQECGQSGLAGQPRPAGAEQAPSGGARMPSDGTVQGHFAGAARASQPARRPDGQGTSVDRDVRRASGAGAESREQRGAPRPVRPMSAESGAAAPRRPISAEGGAPRRPSSSAGGAAVRGGAGADGVRRAPAARPIDTAAAQARPADAANISASKGSGVSAARPAQSAPLSDAARAAGQRQTAPRAESAGSRAAQGANFAHGAGAAANGAPMRAPRPRPVAPNAFAKGAVVPSDGTELEKKEAPGAAASKEAAKTPAYAARRAYTPTELPSGVSASKSSGTAPATTPKGDNTRAGADMMTSVVKGIIYMVLVLVVSVFISIFAIRIGNDVFAFVKSDEVIDVTIPEGATTSEIASILSDNGIIKYPAIFKLYASLKHEKGEYVAGSYSVSPSMSYDQLRNSFKKQIETGTCWITIPEGYTTDEIIDLMVENGIGTREKYIDVINNYDFDFWFIDELEENGVSPDRYYRLDGYLFPDSYEFYKASSEETVIKKLLARFDEVFVSDYKTRAAQLGYTVDQIVTIASLVEKEAGRSSDFMYVSSVFHNRLNDPGNFPRLESDATVVYAIQANTGVRPKEVTPEDLKYESPYNTYLNSGLTPGPITNPSASAIRYALYPANTNYKYFVSADNGQTFFAATKGEHDANIQTVKQLNDQK